MQLPFGGTEASDTFETGTRAAAWGGVTTIVECGPGKVLTALSKRIERRPGLTMLAVEDPDGLAAALAACRGGAA
jgi:malonyl CoA-acyl carrier protein transacylase